MKCGFDISSSCQIVPSGLFLRSQNVNLKGISVIRVNGQFRPIISVFVKVSISLNYTSQKTCIQNSSRKAFASPLPKPDVRITELTGGCEYTIEYQSYMNIMQVHYRSIQAITAQLRC